MLARRHAEYHQDLLEASAQNEATADDWPAAYATDIDNIRAALAWAFAPGGDRSIGVALAVASAPIWLEMSLLTECHTWMAKALDLLDAADRGTRREMVLQCTLGLSLMFTQGRSNRPRIALTRASELAESIQDFDYELRAVYGLVTLCLRLEDFQGALALGRRSEAIAKRIGNPRASSTADSILTAPLFFLGEYAEALTYAKRAYRQDRLVVRLPQIVRSGYDLSIWARCVVAQILWLHGLLDQSAQATREVLADAEASGNPVALCVALIWSGCPILLRLGDLETAERWIARLKDDAENRALSGYYVSGLGFEGQLSAKRGDVAAAERLLRASLVGLREAQQEILYTRFLSGLAEVLAAAGRFEESSCGSGRGAAARRTQQRVLVGAGSGAHQKRSPAVVRSSECGCGGADFPPIPRVGVSAGRAFLGIAHRHEPRPVAARPGSHRGGPGSPFLGLWSLYRRVWQRRSAGGKTAPRRVGRCRPWLRSIIVDRAAGSPLRTVAQVGPRSPITGDFVDIPLATAPPGSGKRPRTSSCRRNRPGVQCR